MQYMLILVQASNRFQGLTKIINDIFHILNASVVGIHDSVLAV